MAFLIESWRVIEGMQVWRWWQRSSSLALNVLYSPVFTMKMLFLICIYGQRVEPEKAGILWLWAHFQRAATNKYLEWNRPVTRTGQQSNSTEVNLLPLRKSSTWSTGAALITSGSLVTRQETTLLWSITVVQTFRNNYTLWNGKLRSQQPLMLLTTTTKKRRRLTMFYLFCSEKAMRMSRNPYTHPASTPGHPSATLQQCPRRWFTQAQHPHTHTHTNSPPLCGWRVRRVISLKRSVKVSPAKTLSLLSLLICWICAWLMSNPLRPSDCV